VARLYGCQYQRGCPVAGAGIDALLPPDAAASAEPDITSSIVQVADLFGRIGPVDVIVHAAGFTRDRLLHMSDRDFDDVLAELMKRARKNVHTPMTRMIRVPPPSGIVAEPKLYPMLSVDL
jgi:NAD(P)-dependent dehydrogenase (short-subunit alcohol dehydrogenase family)